MDTWTKLEPNNAVGLIKPDLISHLTFRLVLRSFEGQRVRPGSRSQRVKLDKSRGIRDLGAPKNSV